MNKTNLIFCLIFLSSCSTKLFVATDNAHIISDSKGTMYYSNNHYNFHSEINIEQDNNNIDTVINKRTKRILQLAKFNKKQDTILFTGRSGLLVLKANATNLNKFKIINLYDTVLSKYPYNYWKVNFYRQIIIDKKHKTYIINDLIPFKNKFLQKLEYNETDYNAYVDPTDLNDIVSYYNFYIKSIPQTKETYLSTLGKSTVKFSNPFDLFNNLFLKDTLFNYNAAYNAQKKAYNYYSSPNKDFFRQ
ncbi:MAG: hypothetical protein FWF72_00040, partial [Paludibacter sp.]|nr:hypothetical protein [Paludibacter sp.]